MQILPPPVQLTEYGFTYDGTNFTSNSDNPKFFFIGLNKSTGYSERDYLNPGAAIQLNKYSRLTCYVGQDTLSGALFIYGIEAPYFDESYEVITCINESKTFVSNFIKMGDYIRNTIKCFSFYNYKS